jgi:hypothetical protein
LHRPDDFNQIPNLPSVAVINNAANGNGFSPHPESEPIRTVAAQPPQVEYSVKVENIGVLNGRRTSRDKSPVPPPLRVALVSPVSPPAPVKPEPGSDPQMTKEELRCVLIRNQNMRQMIYKEVKRPGKDYSKLFEMLRDLHGPPSVRRSYIYDVINEARRFKRETLVDKLEKALDDLISVPVV